MTSPPGQLPPSRSLRVEVPEEEALQFGVRQEEEAPSAHGPASRKYSPGTMIRDAAAYLGLSRTPRAQTNRVSVNPLMRAAGDAKYNTSRELKAGEAPAEESSGGGVERTRVIYLDPPVSKKPQGSEFVSNRVVTSKYNFITFLPIFLLEMFSRVAYLYFLLQAGLSWWSVISPFSGYGSTAALVFVLAVAGIKAIWEDVKRHHEDKRMNTSATQRLNPDGNVTDILWTDVRVGDVIVVRDGELFPADLMCLYSSLPENVCFIKTTNLDGETNLKIRKPLDLKGLPMNDLASVMSLKLTLTAEDANRNLHKFRGKAHLVHEYFRDMPLSPGGAQRGADAGATLEVPVTMNEMLLRGCMLKNTERIAGMVVYTGKETRIQMNAAKTPLKVGSFDLFLNLQIALVIAMQLAMCLFCAIANYVWIQQEGKKRYYLALDVYVQGNWENAGAQICLTFLTFWILLSYLVPISLFVTLEIVKFIQGFGFVNFDRDMRDPKTREWARCRNSNLNEDLGKIEYIFSDKTGTLTSNEMQLRQIAVKGVAYGTSDLRLEEHLDKTGLRALRLFDQRLYKAAARVQRSSSWNGLITAGGSSKRIMAHPTSYPNLEAVGSLGLDGEAASADGADDEVANSPLPGQAHDWEEGSTALGHHLVDFWTNICLCQSLILEKNPAGGANLFQGPSPDEVALVDGARQIGFEFKERSHSSVRLDMQGEEVLYEVLNVMEYSSDRGCMSVIARAPDGTIRLYCKGSDAKVLQKIRRDTPPELMDNTNANLHYFAKQGLRTLVLGTKIIAPATYQEWDRRYQEAAASFVDRDERLDALGKEIEEGLELIGVTAIEDKLQEGVPAAIQTLLDASIRVWMITGDKQETAVNIAVSCRLVHNPEDVMMLNVDEKSKDTAARDADELLDKFLRRVMQLYKEDTGAEVPAEGKAGPVGSVCALPSEWQKAELAVDGPSLNFILADDSMRHKLAVLAAHCSGVVVSRSSPSQKAAIVKMMTKYEMWKAAGSSRGLTRWYAMHRRRLQGKMLSIGDGANDVAMLQTADVGIGIMGKEGRQAVNNSDYAISQFRFLVPLLLVHGNLSYYRLARLIKYSFYKNITFAFVLFYYQFYAGFSGQALVDSITAAVFNVVFTALPILLFSILDRPVKNLKALVRYPQMYNKRGSHSLTTLTFWKTGVLMGAVHGAVCFFIPYYSLATSGRSNITDVYSLGKVAFVALLGTVTLEVALVARYWTWLFGILTVISYALVYPYLVVFPLLEMAFSYYDPANIGVSDQVLSSATFWFVILVCYIITFGSRYLERTAKWAFKPQDSCILSEKERKDGLMRDLSAPTRKRLSELGVVRMRSKAGLDLERGGDEHSSGETPHLRGQHGSTQFSGEADDEARDTVGSSLDVAGGFDPDMPPPPGQMREWDALSGRSPSMVRFAAHTRSASGTTYPLQR